MTSTKSATQITIKSEVFARNGIRDTSAATRHIIPIKKPIAKDKKLTLIVGFYARRSKFCAIQAEVAPRKVRVDTYLQYLTQEHTLYGVIFQNWMLLVVAIFLVWIGLQKSIRD
jgi:hypothetical protein